MVGTQCCKVVWLESGWVDFFLFERLGQLVHHVSELSLAIHVCTLEFEKVSICIPPSAVAAEFHESVDCGLQHLAQDLKKLDATFGESQNRFTFEDQKLLNSQFRSHAELLTAVATKRSTNACIRIQIFKAVRKSLPTTLEGIAGAKRLLR